MQNNKPYEALSYTKSNELVSAKYKSTLLENQLVAIALTRIESKDPSENSPLKARLYPNELKRLIGDPTHIYTRLKRVSKNMTGHSIVIEDGKGNFKAFAIVTNADYVDGILEITLNNELRPHILGLEKRYTTLDLSIMTSFRRDASFRLYEIFKSHIYKSKSHINDGKVTIEYGINELRFMIGLANADDESIKSLRASMKTEIDWDLLYEKLDDRAKVYKRYSEFERNVLKPAQKELEETADIRFEYKALRLGRFMKRIQFDLYANEPIKKEKNDEKKKYLDKKKMEGYQNCLPRDLEEFSFLYEKYVGHNELIAEDIDVFLKKAKLNATLVEDAINDADSKNEISNYCGYIISYIERGGYKVIKTLNGSSENYERINAIKEDYELNKSDIAKQTWDKIKTFDTFLNFKDNILKKGLTVEMLELSYSYEELVKMYTEAQLHKM